jgi:hypothetical protein
VTAAAVFDGLVYLGMGLRGELWTWDGSALEVVAKGLTADGDELRGLAVWRGALWVSARNGSELRLKRFDGSSWSEPAGGTAIDASAGSGRGLAVLSNKLYAAGRKGSSTAPVVVADAAVFPTAARTLETSLFSAGLGADNKVWRSLTVNHATLVSGQSVRVDYQLEDTGSWFNLGTSSAVGATSAAFSFGAGVVGKLVALRLILTATASATPVVYQVLLRYALQPATKRRWTLEALYEGTAELPLITLDQAPSPQTGAQIEAAVWAQKAANGPISFVDLDGSSYSVWFVDHEVSVAERSQRRGSNLRGRLTLVEA